MIRKISLIIVSIMVIWVINPASIQAGNQTIVIKAEHDMTAQSLAHRAFQFMARRVSEKTNGKVKIEIYPSLQLSGGNIPNMIRQTQAGAEDLALIPSSVYTPFQYEHGIWSLPFIFKDLGDEYKLTNSKVGDKLYQITDSSLVVEGIKDDTRGALYDRF